VPGDPESSPFLHAFEFGGRMYKVFTPGERRLWEDWIREVPKNRATRTAAGTPAGNGVTTTADPADDPTAVAAKSWRPGTVPAPAPDARPHVPHLLLSSPPEVVERSPRQSLLGQASVH
jgi:hypothetical protein